jgi:hypothetical protein
MPWRLGVLKKATSRFGIRRFLYALALFSLELILSVVIIVRLLHVSVVGDSLYLGESRELGTHATVDAIAAFQTSGVEVKKAQKLRVSPDGRVAVAIDHQVHLAQAVKGYIVQRSPKGRWPDFIQKRYPEVPLTE